LAFTVLGLNWLLTTCILIIVSTFANATLKQQVNKASKKTFFIM